MAASTCAHDSPPDGFHYAGTPCRLIEDHFDPEKRVFSKRIRRAAKSPRETYSDIIFIDDDEVSRDNKQIY